MEREADCVNGCENSPNEACSDPNGCGLYAYKPHMDTYCWGEVELTGLILEGEFGYRAQFARPVRINRGLFRQRFLHKTPDFADRVLEKIVQRYGMEVVESWEPLVSPSESS